MIYHSTNNRSITADFREATIQGQAPDRGLYFPENIPQLPSGFLNCIEEFSRTEIAMQVIQPFVGESIPAQRLLPIVEETINFDFPLINVTPDIASLELFHGPTLAFKDVGAKFMSRCLGYFMEQNKRALTVLVATSGDTGGAVANGFYKVDGVKVVILYPSGKVSKMQELQLTTLGHNITALEIDGSFDDCQRMVKDAFLHQELSGKRLLTSANSINVARWLPQQFYYFFAWQQWPDKKRPPVISVPSGNFGNLCAGLLAQRSGLPVKKFIAACNANDAVPRFLQSGNYAAKETIPTISNAMDVGDPSNFVRIMALFNNDVSKLKDIMSAASISDERTKNTMNAVMRDCQYQLDPHGAVAYTALSDYLQKHPSEKGYFLETAHAVKFGDAADLPSSIIELLNREKKSIRMKAESETLIDFLLQDL